MKPYRFIGYGFTASVALVLAIVSLTFASPAHAASFTPGNLVVYRVGSGTGSLVSTGNPVYLDEYTPSGTLVQSIALPTVANGAQKQLIASGTAGSEGFLTRSSDGQYLLLAGYGTNIPYAASLASSTAISVPRVIGRVDANGNIDTSTALTDFSSANSPRSAVSTDGTTIWATSGIGIRVTMVGAVTSTLVSSVNSRQVNVFAGQLYLSSSSGTETNKGVNTVGTGLPTTGGQTVARLPGLTDATSPSAYGFFLADLDENVAGLDTLYIADDDVTALQKFSLVSGSWLSNGSIGTATDDYRGLTGAVSGTTVTLYATRSGGSSSTGGGELVALIDASGYNGLFTGTPTLLATAAISTAFRGVAFAPVTIVTATPTATSTSTPTFTPTNTVTDTPTATATPTHTSTDTPIPSATSTATATATETTVPTATPSNTSTPSATSTATPSLTDTPTDTPIPSATSTATATATETTVPTATPSNTSTPSATSTATPSSTDTPTDTPIPSPTSTATATATETTVPTATPSNTSTPSATSTATPSSTDTPTDTPIPSPTSTATATATETTVPTATPSNTSTPTNTPTVTTSPTDTPTDTPIPSPTSTTTATETMVPTATPSNTSTPTTITSPTDTPTDTPVPSATSTATATETMVPTVTPSNTSTPSATSTATPLPTGTITPSVTATHTPTSTSTATATATTTPTPHATVVVSTDQPVTLTYTDTEGSAIAVHLPTGAVSETITLAYTDLGTLPTDPPSGFQFGNQIFDLDAFHNDTLLENFTFQQPVTITLSYSDADVADLDEASLTVRYFDPKSNQWQTEGITIVERDLNNNRITFTVTHLTVFGMFGSSETSFRSYLPFVVR